MFQYFNIPIFQYSNIPIFHDFPISVKPPMKRRNLETALRHVSDTLAPPIAQPTTKPSRIKINTLTNANNNYVAHRHRHYKNIPWRRAIPHVPAVTPRDVTRPARHIRSVQIAPIGLLPSDCSRRIGPLVLVNYHFSSQRSMRMQRRSGSPPVAGPASRESQNKRGMASRTTLHFVV